MTDPLSAEFQRAAGEGRLALHRCTTCGTHQLPPRSGCASCGGGSFEWVDAKGSGVVESFSVLHRAPDARNVPYVYALVRLDEGPVVVSNVVGVDPAGVAIGQRVAVTFDLEDADGVRWPVYRPTD